MRVMTSTLVDNALNYAVIHALTGEKPSGYLEDYSNDEDLVNVLIDTYSIQVRQRSVDWVAQMNTVVESGPTREIAVCQCFAVSVLGEYTDIPDELLIGY